MLLGGKLMLLGVPIFKHFRVRNELNFSDVYRNVNYISR